MTIITYLLKISSNFVLNNKACFKGNVFCNKVFICLKLIDNTSKCNYETKGYYTFIELDENIILIGYRTKVVAFDFCIS